MHDICWDFIADLEGASVLTGYVPHGRDHLPLEKSGVTIGSGVDIGQMSALDLSTLGLSKALVEKFLPYVTLRRHEAVTALAEKPLILTREEADALDEAVRTRRVKGLALRYDLDIEKRPRIVPRPLLFHDLPSEAQTVLCSLAWQYGLGLSTKCPTAWALAVAQDWHGLVGELESFGDNFPTRRKKEAALLRTILA